MKKIMFNDKYGLTELVLAKRKTQTRRIAYYGDIEKPCIAFRIDVSHKGKRALCNGKQIVAASTYAKGEEVAVAQAYKKAGVKFIELQECVLHGKPAPKGKKEWGFVKSMPGYTNKMFVRADLMPHRISITNIRAERLQDISEEDCLAEGIWEAHNVGLKGATYWYTNLVNSPYRTAKEAYASLIDRISGKGTWKRNPYVFIYEFELIK